MRAASGLSVGLSVCLFALIGCASPKPAAPTAAAAQETEQQRAQRLIDYSVESGQPIHTADGKKIVCKQESVTNTRLKNKKICLSQDEWVARTDNARNGLGEAIKSGESLPPEGK